MNDKLLFLWSTDSSYIKDAKKVTLVKVRDDGRSLLLRLNIDDKLKIIRKILEEDENIKMDDNLLFSWFIDSSDIKDAKKVTLDEESDLSLRDIIKHNNPLCLIPNHTKNIRVKVAEEDGRSSFLRLDIEDKLEKIDTKKVTCDKESDLSLRDIIKNNDTLCLIDDYTDFKDIFKLGYGRILIPNKINIEISKEKVCTMEITVLDNGGDKKDGDLSEFELKKGWANKISMFFNGKVKIMDYGPAGLSLHADTIFQIEKKYKFIKVPKITLKLDKFELKLNFIEEVKKA
ncbi:hypothetical protein C1646_821676 [Rhizophagus diaphanus]|nr:hypothetical protein C1646_821676 [Rhizophagus diaphanus] [Rhizophagus sp. MUCL 43196]